MTLYGYKKCGTCRNAEKYLEKHQIPYEFIDITLHPPSKGTLKKILIASKQPLKKLFNTSGQAYRDMGLKSRIDSLSEGEGLGMLADNGKLIKRPLVFDGKTATIGFREEEFQQSWT